MKPTIDIFLVLFDENQYMSQKLGRSL